jgi:UDPglucose--hexose-1-phosphate uridylyltransferase
MIRQEMEYRHRDISENRDFIAFSPFASRSPFEIFIIPRTHRSHFTDITDEEIDSFARVLKEVLVRIKLVLRDPPYNFVIHTSPINNNEETDYYHWHVEVMPKLSKIAGFEWGAGFYINSTSPELASKYLKEVKI